ncbi:MAG: S1 RNA-binding domain-containing protein [Aigarchaeota archaeon]|nr:S1 RNA-binding domain-containing protein [Aigarchaeota archaeon]
MSVYTSVSLIRMVIRVKNRGLPAFGDLVIGTVKRIDTYGAYVTLDEYGGIEARVDRREIALRRIRSIKRHLQVGQQTVFKVKRAQERPVQIDLSLRRVQRNERREKLISWNQQQKVEKILTTLAERTGVSDQTVEESVVKPLWDRGEDVYATFKKISEKRKLPAELSGIPGNLQDELIRLCSSEIQPRKEFLTGILILSSRNKYGANDIREAALAALSAGTEDATVTLNVMGTPLYRLRVESSDKKVAIAVFDSAVQKSIAKIEERGGFGELKGE